MGGGIQSILKKCSVTPPNFILEQQTVSHMKAEIWYPIEVAEVEIRASGGRRICLCPSKKKIQGIIFFNINRGQ